MARVRYDDALTMTIEASGASKITAHPVAPGKPVSLYVHATRYGTHKLTADAAGERSVKDCKTFEDAAREGLRRAKAVNRSWRRTTRNRAAAAKAVAA